MRLRYSLLCGVALTVLAYRAYAFTFNFTFLEPGAVGHLWPDSTNSGVPAGTTLTPSGSITVTTNGTVIDSLDVTGTITINANNVTVQNTRVTGATSTGVIYVTYGYTGTVIQHCTINGTGTSNAGSNGIQATGTITYNNIYNIENGINHVGADTSTTIHDNYIHTLLASGSPHYDGIQMDGGNSNTTISHNTIYNNNDQTSATMVDNYFGGSSNITITDNVLLGGGYTGYCDGTQGVGALTGIAYTNNHLGGGYYGDFDFNSCTPTNTGNVDDGLAIWATLTP